MFTFIIYTIFVKNGQMSNRKNSSCKIIQFEQMYKQIKVKRLLNNISYFLLNKIFLCSIYTFFFKIYKVMTEKRI